AESPYRAVEAREDDVAPLGGVHDRLLVGGVPVILPSRDEAGPHGNAGRTHREGGSEAAAVVDAAGHHHGHLDATEDLRCEHHRVHRPGMGVAAHLEATRDHCVHTGL